MERMRTAEAAAARDVIAQHLSLACKSIRDKAAMIDTLRQQNKYLEDILNENSLIHAPATSALASQSELPSPAPQEAPFVKPIDENLKAHSTILNEPPSSDIATEEEPPKYEVTEALSQVW